jgi:hypothetical protein
VTFGFPWSCLFDGGVGGAGSKPISYITPYNQAVKWDVRVNIS